jgi:hypothetical protein
MNTFSLTLVPELNKKGSIRPIVQLVMFDSM